MGKDSDFPAQQSVQGKDDSTQPDVLPELVQLANRSWNQKEEIASRLMGASFLTYRPRRVRTIAMYYRSIRNGGAERVTAQLSSAFSQIRSQNGQLQYRVILITEEEPQPDDYPVSQDVIRCTLPEQGRFPKEDFMIRAAAWRELIDRYQIDVVIHGHWFEEYGFWDMLAIKSAPSGPAFVYHVHSFCGRLFSMESISIEALTDAFSIADGIVTLSSCDRKYWQGVNGRTYTIPNPSAFRARDDHRAHFGKEILWIGRVAPLKRPLEIAGIMRLVADEVPDAVCRFVGSEDPDLMDRLKTEVFALGLEDHFIFEGFQADVSAYYENASVFLMTSRFEGFSLTLMESAAYGMPSVIYALPWIEPVRILDGVASVPQMDRAAAADEIIRLITDEKYWKEKSDANYESFRRYEECDPVSEWLQVFSDLEQDAYPPQAQNDPDYDIVLRQVGHFHNDLRKSLIRERNEYRSRMIDSYIHARIDLKHEGNDGCSLEILECSDPDAQYSQPEWMTKNGSGYVIKSSAGALDLKVKCFGSGILTVALRGADLHRISSGNRIPVRLDYASFSVDGEVLFDQVKRIWHDHPYRYEKRTVSDQVVSLRIEWSADFITVGSGRDLLQDYYDGQIRSYRDEAAQYRRRIAADAQKISSLENTISRREEEIGNLRGQLTQLRESHAYKIGRALTAPAREVLKRTKD